MTGKGESFRHLTNPICVCVTVTETVPRKLMARPWWPKVTTFTAVTLAANSVVARWRAPQAASASDAPP